MRLLCCKRHIQHGEEKVVIYIKFDKRPMPDLLRALKEVGWFRKGPGVGKDQVPGWYVPEDKGATLVAKLEELRKPRLAQILRGVLEGGGDPPPMEGTTASAPRRIHAAAARLKDLQVRVTQAHRRLKLFFFQARQGRIERYEIAARTTREEGF